MGRLLELRGSRSGGVTLDFERAYDEQLDYVWNSLRRLGIPAADVEDLTQDVFMKVFHSLGDYDNTRPLKPWLFGFCFRVASDYRKHVFHDREMGVDQLEHADDRRNPEQEAVVGEQRALALRALGEVELGRRAVLVMHDFDGHSVPEIVDVLGVPLNTLYSRLRLARAEFEAAILRLTLGGAV
jgi:RNA polymerase sigma-70 factor (ECF subfamily)